MKPLHSVVHVSVLTVLFSFALGAQVQCPSVSVSDTRPSLSILQAQIDALTLRVHQVENPTPKKVFVTSQTFSGDLGGLDGADAICDQAAGAAGLSGTYRAWLGDDSEGPNQRFTRSGPYALLDGTIIAFGWDGLTDGTLLAPINLDEFGQLVPSPGVAWTNVEVEGNRMSPDPSLPDADSHCDNWTYEAVDHVGRGGRSDTTLGPWTATRSSFVACISQLRLYCFEQ